MEIKTLVAKAHENAVKHGFWEPPLAFGTAIALIHSELSEALEEERNGNPDVWFACNESDNFICTPQDETECLMYGKESLCKYRSRKPEGVAVDRRFNRDKADYINIIAWRQTAEFVAKHFAKGQRVAIVGSIQTRSWEDNDGGKHKAVEIVADSVYFADAKKESAAGSYAESAMTSEGFEVTDEDIPF